MEDILKKIAETEKQSSSEIEKVTAEFKSKIEKQRNSLEDNKNTAIKEIIATNKNRKDVAIKEAQDQVDSELELIQKEKENLINNKELCKSIKQDIISTVLS